MKILDGRVVVITGGTRGLGLASAQACAREGAAVVIGSRSAPAVERAQALLRAGGAQAAGRPCDVSEIQQVEALAQTAVDAFGGFDIWVNNAGVAAPYGPTAEIAVERFVETVRVDVLGAYHGSLVALRHFLPRGAGKLINILGSGDRRPDPFNNPYGSSKAWIRNFTLALAREYGGAGVGIFAFNPGLMITDLLTRLDVVAGYEQRAMVLKTVMRMWGNPPDVPAQRIVWLASAATDGRRSLEVRELGAGRLLRGALREGVRRLLRRPATGPELEITTVPPAGPKAGGSR